MEFIPKYANVKYDVVESLCAYAQEHRPVGGFLEAVLSNDLFDACGRADAQNKAALTDIVSYVWNELPGHCWGSREKYAAWIAARPL